jgi:hypothetical protein
MPQYSVLVCRFPGGACEHPDAVDWFVRTMLFLKTDPRIGDVFDYKMDDTPITMSRNHALEVAKAKKVDFVIMVDSDMNPDAYWRGNPNRLGFDPNAKEFVPLALDFLLQHEGPAFICAPYCGRPPIENVFVFRWRKFQSDHPDGEIDNKLEAYTREEAAERGGIEEVGAAPTGLVMFHTACLDTLTPPYTYYEWKDSTQSVKHSTEDVTFTRDMSLNGVPVYCAWDCWAGHWKLKCVGKPIVLPIEQVRENFRTTVLRNHKQGEQLVMVNEGKPKPTVPRGKKAKP